MKRFKPLLRASARDLGQPRQSLRTAAFAALSLVSVGVGCLDDDPIDDAADDGAAGTRAVATAGTGGTGGAGGSGGSAASPAAGNGGAGATTGGGAGASNSTGNAGAAGNSDAENMSTDTGAAPGETGIFVGMTAAHNAARAALGIDPPLPDLEWSPELATFAQQWSDNLTSECGTIEHRMQNMYGENIATRGSSSIRAPFSPEEAVDGWDAEVACWDYGTINGTESCDADCATALFSNGCGHYTQLVWRNTRRVGCGYSTCEARGLSWEIWVCNYDPPGNYIGQTPY
jgi:pathogenesis-related protein 1